MLALEPPGNVARDLAEYRRKLFRDLGEGSALAFPEIAPLAFFEASPRPPRDLIGRELDSLWRACSGSFASEGLDLHRDRFYLKLSGPLLELSQASAEAFGGMGMLPRSAAPLESAEGFFLCRASASDSDASSLPSPPRLSFKDCSLVAMGLSWSVDPMRALTWRELARSKRRTGPSPLPSRRLRRS
jgi:hypothetical protein